MENHQLPRCISFGPPAGRTSLLRISPGRRVYNGDLQSTEMMGVSAGSLAAVVLKLQIPHQELLNIIVGIGKKEEADFKGVSLVG